MQVFAGEGGTLYRVGESYRFSAVMEDCGDGFDWRRYLEFSPERAFDPNGRGIAMARQTSFASLEYLGRGNVAVATIAVAAEAASRQ